MTSGRSRMAEGYECDAYYEDANGFLWRWSSTTFGADLKHYQWFPQAYTGPGVVPGPALPVRKVYGNDGYRVTADARPTS